MTDTPVLDNAVSEAVPLPLPIIPTCEQMAMAAVQSLSGLPADRSGAVHWDHVLKVLYVPNV